MLCTLWVIEASNCTVVYEPSDTFVGVCAIKLEMTVLYHNIHYILIKKYIYQVRQSQELKNRVFV